MTSWSGFWGDGQGSTGAYALQRNRSPNRYHLARLFKKVGMRKLAEQIATIGADSTPASSASVTISQIDAARDVNANVQGGVRGVTSLERMNALHGGPGDSGANTARAIAAADVTDLNDILPGGDDATRAPTNGSGTITYPVDKSGNGGGGKQALG